GADGGAVSQLLGLRGGEIALGLPVRVGRIVDDDGDQTTLAPAGLALGIGVVIGVARAGGETGRGGADTAGGERLPAVHDGFLSVRARYSDLGRAGAGERLSARGYAVRRPGGRVLVSRGIRRSGGPAVTMGRSLAARPGARVGGSPGRAAIRVLATRGRVCCSPGGAGTRVFASGGRRRAGAPGACAAHVSAPRPGRRLAIQCRIPRRAAPRDVALLVVLRTSYHAPRSFSRPPPVLENGA